MRLCDALGIQRGEMVAFVGAGGKTAALVRSGRELQKQGWRVLAATTTRIAEDELVNFPFVLALGSKPDPRRISKLLTEHQFLFLYERIWGGRALGLPPALISELADSVDSDVILIEADGARHLSLKAPRDHEPNLPDDVSLVVPVAGMDILNQPLDAAHVLNAQKIIEIYGFPENTPIQPAWIAQTLRDENLGLKDIPKGARVVALLNKVEKGLRYKARRTAHMVLAEKRISAVAVGRVQNSKRPVFELQRRVGAIVLAGGLSRRMGQSKPLLPWGRRTIIETIARRLSSMPLADVVVVTGHQTKEVQAVLQDLAIRTVYNPAYASGEMLSSIQTGLKSLDSSISACLIFLGDQPLVNPRLVHHILLAYAEGHGSIVAPSYMKRRGHPILIDRKYWREILNLPFDRSLRDVMNAYKDETAYVVTDDDNILRDMDTPEDYREALRRAGLL